VASFTASRIGTMKVRFVTDGSAPDATKAAASKQKPA
jgi:hypothetical protein